MRLSSSLLLVSVLFGCASARGQIGDSRDQVSGRQPNIVLIMADDMGWGDTGFQGSRVARTPNLDAMARNGMRFNRFYAASPVCSPTRGSMLTGRHPHRYGIWSANVGHLPEAEATLAEVLQERGYTAGFFGKWHLGTLTVEARDANRGDPAGAEHFSPPVRHGFHSVFATESKVPTYDPMLRPKNVQRDTWWDPVADPDEAMQYGPAYWDEDGVRVKEGLEGDDSRVVVDRAISFICLSAAERRPFLAVIWLHTPHLPVVADSSHRRPFAEQDAFSQHYFGSILALDEQVGRLRQTLRETGIAEETLVWFSSDNGPEGEEGSDPGSTGGLRDRKRDLYEGGIRVPGVLEWPRVVRAGSTSDVPVVSSDVLPTVLDVVGASLPDSRPIDGESILPLLRGEMWPRRRPIGFAFRGQFALVGPRYKLIHVPPSPLPPGRGPATTRGLGFQLYDLWSDPGERDDLAGERASVVGPMRAELESWWRSVQKSQRGTDYSPRRNTP